VTKKRGGGVEEPVNAMVETWTPSRGATSGLPSFAQVAEAHLDDVHRYLLLMTANRAVAEDLTSETFERALRRFRRYDPRRASPKTWLLALARSSALDHFRSEERRRRREERYAAVAEEMYEPISDGFSAELDRALRTLSPGEREVVGLRVVLELDGEATARLLGISPTACSTRLSRALQKLEERTSRDAVA
jgi:RNA polymerase sigma-70 factor, ECF subfamily